MQMLTHVDRWAVFCSKAQLAELIDKAEENELSWALVTWNKPNPTPLTNSNYLPDTEYVIHAFDSGGVYGGYRDKSRFFVYPAQQSEYDHPTVKPLPVMQKVLATASDVGQTVFDPFMGTGSTGVACAAMGRKFIGIEISPRYFDIACRRIEQAYAQPDMFGPLKDKPIQEVML